MQILLVNARMRCTLTISLLLGLSLTALDPLQNIRASPAAITPGEPVPMATRNPSHRSGNHAQVDPWLEWKYQFQRLGVAHMRLERWPAAVPGYRFCCEIPSDNGTDCGRRFVITGESARGVLERGQTAVLAWRKFSSTPNANR